MTSGPAQAEQFATLRVLEGTVEVRPADEDAARPATDGESLSNGDAVLTGPDGRAEIEYFDGSLTRIEPETEFIVQELATLDNEANSKVIETEQTEGRTYNRITKLADADSRVQVETPTATASVRGTSFAVEVVALPDGSIQVVVWCVTGTCVVTPEDGEPVILEAGEGVIVDENGTVERFTFDPSELPDWITLHACDLDDVEQPCIEVQAGATTGDDSTNEDSTNEESVNEETPAPVVLVSGGGPSQSNDGNGDTTPPVTTITQGPANPTSSTDAFFRFTASEAGSTFQCRLDGGAYQDCASPRAYAGLGDGTHTFRVRATDPAGNTGDPAVHVWRVDTVAPTVEITSEPDDPTSSTEAVFEFEANEANSTFECRLDDGDFAQCESGDTFQVDHGNRSFQVRATDLAGNTGDPAAYGWTVDTLAPVSVIGHPVAGAYNEDSWNAGCETPDAGDICGTADGTGSDVEKVEVSIQRNDGDHWNGDDWGAAESRMEADGTDEWTLDFDFSAFDEVEGEYTVRASATDAAGNVEATAETTFSVDLTNPDVTVERADGQADPTDTTPINFTVTFSEPVLGFGADDVFITGTAGETTAVDVTGDGPAYNVAISVASDGTVVVDIPANRVTDAAGNGNNASTGADNHVTYHTVVVDEGNQAPVAGQPRNCHLGNETSVVITLFANDHGRGPLTFELVSGPSHGTLYWTPPTLTYTALESFHKQDSFEWRAVNADGLSSQVFTTTIRWKGNNGCGGPG